MYHAVRISYALGEGEEEEIAKKVGAPEPKGEKKVDDLSFINQGVDEDEAEEARIVAGGASPVEVDASADVASSPAPSHPVAPEPEEDEGDFTGLKDTHDELDRQVDTDKPVPTVSTGNVVVVGKGEEATQDIDVGAKPKDEPVHEMFDTSNLAESLRKAREETLIPARKPTAPTEVSINEPKEATGTPKLGGDIEATESMEGIGSEDEKHPAARHPHHPHKPGKKGGRGSHGHK
jgi:hypothetical protein